MNEQELLNRMREIERTPFDLLTDQQKQQWREVFTLWCEIQKQPERKNP